MPTGMLALRLTRLWAELTGGPVGLVTVRRPIYGRFPMMFEKLFLVSSLLMRLCSKAMNCLSALIGDIFDLLLFWVSATMPFVLALFLFTMGLTPGCCITLLIMHM